MDINFFEHFGLDALISLLPGIFGAILGVAIAHPFRRVLGKPATKFWFLFPWRAFILLALVILLPSPYVSILFGLGISPALATVFLSSAVLAVGIVLHGATLASYDNGTAAALSAYVPTALVASVGFAVVTHEFGSGSAGFLVRQGMQLFEYGVMWTGYAIVGILAILVDVAAGCGELLLMSRANPEVAAR